MKKLLLTAAAILATLNMYGQGTTYQGSVNFNSVGSGKPLLAPDGSLAAGSAYRVALYWGSAATTDDRNMTQIGNSTAMLTGGNPGYFAGLGRTITYQSSPTETANGAILAFQVRGWASQGGTLLTYDAAVAAGAGTGKSAIFTLKTKDLNDPTETIPDMGSAPGFQGFQIVPEPSAIALGLLGAGALLMLRRRK